jgi:hypothetical protein
LSWDLEPSVGLTIGVSTRKSLSDGKRVPSVKVERTPTANLVER